MALYQAELARDQLGRKAAGAYYTPPNLLTCGVALDPLLDRAADPLSLRVIDPAAGAGIFLVSALERISAATGAPRAAIARRCLCGVDLDPGAVALCRIAVAAAAGIDPGELTTSIVCADALLDDVGAGYDAVIGNPPWGQKAVRFSGPVKTALRRRYATATGVLDPFKLFVERAHQIARPGGRWSLVLPDIILLKNQEPVRALILDGSRLSLIADLVLPGDPTAGRPAVRRAQDPPPRRLPAAAARPPGDRVAGLGHRRGRGPVPKWAKLDQ